MRRLSTLFFLVAFLPSFAWLVPASAEGSAPGAAPSRAQAERNAVDLKQGMTPDEVQLLLGKPRRTALRGNGGSPSSPSRGARTARALEAATLHTVAIRLLIPRVVL